MNTGAIALAALSREFRDALQRSETLVQRAQRLVTRAQDAAVRSFDLCVESQYLCEERKYAPARDGNTIATGAG